MVSKSFAPKLVCWEAYGGQLSRDLVVQSTSQLRPVFADCAATLVPQFYRDGDAGLLDNIRTVGPKLLQLVSPAA